ncbi:MAG: hypothetical protein U0271_03360 [Polyangiaceae bacterium]
MACTTASSLFSGALRRFAFLGALVALMWPATAHAWVELHIARDDVRVTMDREGRARVEHRLLLLVGGGPLKTLTIRGVDLDAEVEDGAYVVPEADEKAGSRAASVPIRAERRATTTTPVETDLVLTLGDKGISRGRFVAIVRYTTDLAASGALRLDGQRARLDWVGAEWEDGLETTKATFVLPRGSSEPTSANSADPDASTFFTTLSRKADADLLELVKPYAARGERVVWSVELDRRAVGLGQYDQRGASPALDPHALDALPKADSSFLRRVRNPRDTAFIGGGLALFVLIAALIAAHGLEASERASKRGQRPRPLVAIPLALRAALGAAFFTGGVALELTTAHGSLGALAVAMTALFVLHRPALQKPALRAPGDWLCVRVGEALTPPPRPKQSPFDLGTAAGWIGLAVLAGVFAAAAYGVSRSNLHLGVVVMLDFAPLLALFLSGNARSLAPDLTVDPIRLFRDVVTRVEGAAELRAEKVRVIPRVRLPRGEVDADELRVAFLPARSVRGLRAIELAAHATHGPGGYVLLPELLVRFEVGTAAESSVNAIAPFARTSRGRKPEERVIALAPKLPTAKVTAELVSALLERLSAPVAPSPAQVAVDPVETQGEARKRRAPARRRAAMPVPDFEAEPERAA